jgi:uncharacterized protein YifE (UPF0438 family)
MPSLTQREQDLLHRYRRFYLDLVEGRRLPETDAQRRFLEVAAGRRPPVTEHERLWVRWQRMVRDRNVRAIKRRWGRTSPQASRRQPAVPTFTTSANGRDPGLQPGRWSVALGNSPTRPSKRCRPPTRGKPPTPGRPTLIPAVSHDGE